MSASVSCGDAHVLESDEIRLVFDAQHGRLVELSDRRRDIRLVGEPRLAESFRLQLALPDYRGHVIRGRDQSLEAVERAESSLRLHWSGLSSDRGRFDVDYTLIATLEADGVVFHSELTNRSDHTIAEVQPVVLGGMANPEERDDWALFKTAWGGQAWETTFYRDFVQVYLGPELPTEYHDWSSMPWLDLYHRGERKGAYLSPEDPESRFGAWMFQLAPSANWGGYVWRWPEPGPEPVGMAVAWTQFTEIGPGGSWRSAPVAVRFHDGVWYEAARLYRRFWDRHFSLPDPDNWLSEEDAWQSTILSYPDDRIEFRFRDLPELARSARSAGIRVLQIDGWDRGGLDRDFPHYEPDPRLGTYEELREAIAECRALGVRVLLFTNLNVANIETDWYRAELHRYARQDAHGNPLDTEGWDYNTVGGHMADRKHRMRECNPGHEAFRAVMERGYRNIARLGADGAQVDKVGTLNKADHHPDLADLDFERRVLAPNLDLFHRHQQVGREQRADYAIAAESHFDRVLPWVRAAYARHWYGQGMPAFSATFPEYRQTCCITGDHDFGLVANCLRIGLVVNIEARCLHGHVGQTPDMAEFVARALALRRRLADAIWDSRLIDPAAIRVEADAGVFHCVHESRTVRGQRAVVFNHFASEERFVRLDALGLPSATVEVHHVLGDSHAVTLPERVRVPPDDCTVVVSRPGPAPPE